MTRKDYEMVADTIARSLSMHNVIEVPALAVTWTLRLAEQLADTFERDNPAFKRDVFLTRATGEYRALVR